MRVQEFEKPMETRRLDGPAQRTVSECVNEDVFSKRPALSR